VGIVAKVKPRAKRFSRPTQDYEPKYGGIPSIDSKEIPGIDDTENLMHAVSHGLGIEASSAYANLPAPLVRNWLARGRKQEVEPFDVSIYDDPEVRRHHLDIHEEITTPCFQLWMEWRRTRAEFIIHNVKKIRNSKDWRAQAWLLERAEPNNYNKPSASPPIKRDLNLNEKEVEAEVIQGGNDVARVTFYCPDNNRAG
jgi:hypothetical protein